MMMSRHITAAEVRHQLRVKERERERKIKCEREREGKKPQATERERELGIFSIMLFDSATFSFTLLVIKSNKKN